MHRGVLSQGCLGRSSPSFPLSFPQSCTYLLKSLQFGQGWLSDNSQLCSFFFLRPFGFPNKRAVEFQLCSILLKYGVHGFPTIFIMNSTLRVRYIGSRSMDSLVAFYSEVTGMSFFLSPAFINHCLFPCTLYFVFIILRFSHKEFRA